MRGVFNLDLLFPAFILTIISLTSLFALDRTLFQNQVLFIFFGFLGFVILSSIDYRIFKNLKLLIFIISVVSLFILLLFGAEIRGAVRWLGVAGARVQLSEIFKPFLIASFAAYLAVSNISFLTFIRSLFFVGIVALPIFLQPDLGNSLVYFFTPILMLVFAGMPMRMFVLTGMGLLIVSPLLWQLLREYQKQRLFSFLNPTLDPLGSSYNLIQSVIAVGAGQILGRGLGYGTQSQLRFLPERHTDFIFATISETFGLVGALLVLGAFTLLLFKIYKIIQEAEDPYGALLASGTFGLLFFQAFINIGGNIGILPITGITLPLVSYGGSSVLSTFILLGIVNSIALSTKKTHKTLEIR